MSQIQFERIWIAQCEAARRVKNRFGLANALDYLIGEKLLNFTQVAERRAEFMQELPDFLREIRAVFSLEEPNEYATQLERTRILRAPDLGTIIGRSQLRSGQGESEDWPTDQGANSR